MVVLCGVLSKTVDKARFEYGVFFFSIPRCLLFTMHPARPVLDDDLPPTLVVEI